jgi:tripartite-type tricarboxylate transporter receptor subunit TctC
LTAPKGTPKEAIDYIHREVVKALAAPEVKERLAAQGAEPSGITPQEMGRMLVEDTKRWTSVIHTAGIKAE